MQNNWSGAARFTAVALGLIALALLLSAARAMIGPLVIGCLLAYLLNPAVGLIKRRTRLSHRLAASLVYLLFLASLAALLILLMPAIARQASGLALELQLILPRLETAFSAPIRLFGVELPLEQLVTDLRNTAAQLLQPDRVFRVLRAATTNLAWVLLILVTPYYLLQDWDRLRGWIFGLPPVAYRADLAVLYEKIERVWQSYLRGQLLMMSLVGVLSGLGAAVVGLPGPALLGLLAGVLAIIPSFGPAVATAIAALVAWFAGSSYLPISNAWSAALTIALFTSIQTVEGIWLQPVIMGRRMRIHPGLVFVSVLGALTLGGALLALIVVPLMASAGVIGSYVYRRVLGIDPFPDRPAARAPEASTAVRATPAGDLGSGR